MKRHATLTIITIILSLFLSACGATQEVTPEPPAEVETVEQVTAEPKVAAVDAEATQTAAAEAQAVTREAEAMQQAETAAMVTAAAQAENEAATAEAERLTELLHPDLEVVAECGDPLGCVTIAPDQPIHLAAVLATGRPFGLDEQYAVQVALAEQDELLGHPFDLRIEDSGCSAAGGQTAATEIATDDSLVAVIGHSCGSSCIPAVQIYDAAGLPMISPSCTPPQLTDPNSGLDVFLRTIPGDPAQAQQIAEFAFQKLGLHTAGTVHDGSPYSAGLTNAFAEAFSELGGEIVFQDTVMPGTSSAVNLGAELIYAPVFAPEGAAIARNASSSGIVLTGADGLMSPEFIETAGQAAEGVYITAPAPDLTGARYEQFRSTYQEISGEAEPLSNFHPYAYDAVTLLVDAIQRAAQQDEEGNLLIGRQALLDALHASQDVKGLTGSLTCTQYGDCAASGLVKVHQVQNGEFVPIYPK